MDNETISFIENLRLEKQKQLRVNIPKHIFTKHEILPRLKKAYYNEKPIIKKK